MAQLFVLMGVSGSGKTTVGQALAARLDCPFYDGDDFHPPENVAKMASGTPLNDADRAPWLARLAELLEKHGERGEKAVLACSALKQKYREKLRVSQQVQFVYLAGSFDLIWQRMAERTNHYMKADMLRSQFAALEPPKVDEAIYVSIDQDVDEIVDQILKAADEAKSSGAITPPRR
ncbi:MAG: gluconokinase [Anaerolineaceae bacterium]|nr:gluconokinase [Anaerolineaceae bacterium]